MLIRPPDKFKVTFKEAQDLTDRNCGWTWLEGAVRLTTDIETGNWPCKKAPIVANAVQSERPWKFDEVDLIDAPKQDVRQKSQTLCAFPPLFVV